MSSVSHPRAQRHGLKLDGRRAVVTGPTLSSETHTSLSTRQKKQHDATRRNTTLHDAAHKHCSPQMDNGYCLGHQGEFTLPHLRGLMLPALPASIACRPTSLTCHTQREGRQHPDDSPWCMTPSPRPQPQRDSRARSVLPWPPTRGTSRCHPERHLQLPLKHFWQPSKTWAAP